MVLTIQIDLMREMELQIDLTELFEPEGYNATEWKKTNRWNRM